MRNFLSHLLFSLILLPFFSLTLLAAFPDSTKTYVFFPKPQPVNKFNLSLGVSMTVIPRAIVQEGVIPLPMLEVRTKYGLSDHFFLTGQANIVYVTNQVSLGIGWADSYKGISFAIADNFGYWFGFADFEGFDAVAMGLTNYPSLTVGAQVDDLSISLRSEVLLSISQHTSFGTSSVGRINPQLAGVAFTLGIEQPLWKDNSILFGTRIQYALPMYQTWLAFSTFHRWLIFPEFFIGYEL